MQRGYFPIDGLRCDPLVQTPCAEVNRCAVCRADWNSSNAFSDRPFCQCTFPPLTNVRHNVRRKSASSGSSCSKRETFVCASRYVSKASSGCPTATCMLPTSIKLCATENCRSMLASPFSASSLRSSTARRHASAGHNLPRRRQQSQLWVVHRRNDHSSKGHGMPRDI